LAAAKDAGTPGGVPVSSTEVDGFLGVHFLVVVLLNFNGLLEAQAANILGTESLWGTYRGFHFLTGLLWVSEAMIVVCNQICD